MLRKRVHRARRHCKVPASSTRNSSYNAASNHQVFNTIIRLLLICMVSFVLFNDIQYQSVNVVVEKSIEADHNSHSMGLPSFSNCFNWFAWCLNNWSVDWHSALLFILRASLSLSVYYATKPNSRIKWKCALQKKKSNPSRRGWQQMKMMMIRKGVGTDVGIASLGTRLFMVYHAMGYIPSITNHFQDEIACMWTAFLAVLLVGWLDMVLGECVSRVIGTFRVNKLGAADVQIGSVLHCILSLILAQSLVGICSSLLKSFVFGGRLWLILWQDLQWEYIVENTLILAGLFALIWTKNSIVSRLRSNRSTLYWIIYQLKAMCSTTMAITQAYIVISALGLLFQAAVYNMSSSNTRQVFHGINEWVMVHYYILIPLNILSGVIGYLILCELCSLFIGDLIVGLNCYIAFMGQKSNNLANEAKIEENKARDKLESKEGEAIVRDLGLARKCFEPHSAMLPKYAGAVREEESLSSCNTSSITPNNGKLQQVQRNSALTAGKIKVEDVNPDEDDELRNL